MAIALTWVAQHRPQLITWRHTTLGAQGTQGLKEQKQVAAL